MEEKSFDQAVADLKDKIVLDINESKLPLSVTSYILKEILQVVTVQLNQGLNKSEEQ